MSGNSRSVSTNQQGVHDKIPELVKRYLQSASEKPIAQHTQNAFDAVKAWLPADTPIVLDSCCGVGESTQKLAKQHPNAVVIGIDKSALRVNKHEFHTDADVNTNSNASVSANFVDNYAVVRADVIDFWRLVKRDNWNVVLHTLFYPNPYPKSAHVQRRWHASASFRDIIDIGGELQVRSNWQLYIEEFALALRCANFDPTTSQIEKDEPISPFERKYWNSGQDSWQLVCRLSKA
ncbi:MAG: SAM-dependent methyltransferase [Alteromonadaceae bacterium]|nr:SAM-dependent methyltransferase [Alteromonadaceae bacterium]